MGDLITLPIRKKPTVAREGAQEAEIVFFTGVRYQRMPEPAPTGAGGASSEGGKRKRKRV